MASPTGPDQPRGDDATGASATGETAPASDAPPRADPAREPRRSPSFPTDRYRLGKELGRGGMGRVVEAFDAQLGRTVAVKEVLARQGSGQHRRFAREIQLTARLEHPSIVPLYDSGVTRDGTPFYVMRRVSGQPLDQRIAQARGLDDRLILLPAVLAAIDAVAHAHNRGVIHRDLKPQNILVGEHGETMVIDWGLAKPIGEADEPVADEPIAGDSLQTQIGSVFGTPGFMSPEQARGEALDLEGDVYALGAVLYQLLAGAPPVAGTSATELMVKTQVHDIRPLAAVAPGVPRELCAIVEKALAFDAANRYPDAGALAADVRRFLAGQLVAAHDYSRWQRIARFCRRHRATLSVAAFAAVAVAVMAWIGVHRIVTERDAATAARRDAEQRRREAERARDRLAERHDELIVAEAASLLDVNPTAAIARLKQLSPRSVRGADARGVAQAAVVRGVAWALPVPTTPLVQLEIAPDAPLLAATARDGNVRVFALDRRREVVARGFGGPVRASWVAGRKLLIAPSAGAPQLFDPVANAVEPLALPPLAYAQVSPDGRHAAVITAADAGRPPGAAVLDVARRTLAPLAFPGPVRQVEIAADASWTAVGGDDQVIVFDRDGRELTRWRGPVVRIVGSSGRAFVVMSDLTHLVECRLGPTPTWVPIVLPPSGRYGALDFGYLGHALWVLTSGTELAMGTAERLTRAEVLHGVTLPVVTSGDDTVIVQSHDGRLHWVGAFGQGTLALPTNSAAPDIGLRLAAGPGTRYVAGVGGGVLLVFDLEPVLPRRVPMPPADRMVFADDDHVMVHVPGLDDWAWVDLATGELTPIGFHVPMLGVGFDVDPETARVQITEVRPAGRRDLILRRGAAPMEVVDTWEDHAWSRLVDGDAVAYGSGDARVFARIGAGPARLVATVGAAVREAYAIDRLAIVVLDAAGEITRIDLATGRAERVALPRAIDGHIVTDREGHLYVFDDRAVQRWDGARLVDVARYDRDISYVFAVSGAILVKLRNGELHLAPSDPAARRGARRILGTLAEIPLPSAGGRLAILRGSRQQLTALEIPSGVTWTLPGLVSMTSAVAVSPTSRRVAQSTQDGLAVWQLPQVGADYAAWLDAQTNATVDRDGVLVWPWQVTAAP